MDKIFGAKALPLKPTRDSVFKQPPKTLVDKVVYEIQPAPANPLVEIVFFHGFELGDFRDAYWEDWLSGDGTNCWLGSWLVEELPEARILTVRYDSSLTRTATEGRVDLYRAAVDLLSALTKFGGHVGQHNCPIVLVGHSLGGLVMKKLVVEVNSIISRDPDDALKTFLSCVRAFFFYATPHQGSGLAESMEESTRGDLVNNLRTLHFETSRLHADFMNLCTKFDWKMAGLGEQFQSKLGQFSGTVVDQTSAAHGIDETNFTMVEADHFTICKPKAKESVSFQYLTFFIKEILNIPRQGVVDSLPFTKDNIYVPLLETIQKVQQALESKTNAQIVILYGGPEDGKTSLAKYLALFHAGALGAGSSNPNKFDSNVYFLSCGPKARRNGLRLLIQLWKDMGFEDSSLDIVYPWDASGIRHQLSSLQCERLRKLFKKKLNQKDVLIVLDNVWDTELIQELLIPSENVKYLVTTQSPTIWPDEQCEKIRISHPNFEEAQQILANYNGVSSGELPQRLENLNSKLRSFPGLVRGLVALLYEDMDPNIQEFALKALGNVESASLQILVADPCALPCLTKLLVLNGNPGIQTAAVQVIKNVPYNDLESCITEGSFPSLLRALVTLLDDEVDPNVQKTALHALVNITYHSENSQKIVGADPGALQCLTRLMAVDGSPELQTLAAEVILHITYSDLESTTKIGSFPGLMGALMALLQQEVDPNIQRNALEALQNITNRSVGSQKMVAGDPAALQCLTRLLAIDGSPEIQQEAARVIAHVACSDLDSRTKVASFPGLVGALVALLDKEVDPNIQRNALEALENITHHSRDSQKIVGADPAALQCLARLLGGDGNPAIQQVAARVIRNIACSDVDSRSKVGSCPGLVEALVAVLHKEVDPNVTRTALKALEKITCGSVDNQKSVGAVPGALRRLTKLLGADGRGKPVIQQVAARVIRNIACSDVDSRSKVGSFPGLVKALVALSHKDRQPVTQNTALQALVKITHHSLENQKILGAYPGALQRLTTFLAFDGQPRNPSGGTSGT